MLNKVQLNEKQMFPISRDPPEGGTRGTVWSYGPRLAFPISRDPPEGGTIPGGKAFIYTEYDKVSNF